MHGAGWGAELDTEAVGGRAGPYSPTEQGSISAKWGKDTMSLEEQLKEGGPWLEEECEGRHETDLLLAASRTTCQNKEWREVTGRQT